MGRQQSETLGTLPISRQKIPQFRSQNDWNNDGIFYSDCHESARSNFPSYLCCSALFSLFVCLLCRPHPRPRDLRIVAKASSWYVSLCVAISYIAGQAMACSGETTTFTGSWAVLPSWQEHALFNEALLEEVQDAVEALSVDIPSCECRY